MGDSTFRVVSLREQQLIDYIVSLRSRRSSLRYMQCCGCPSSMASPPSPVPPDEIPSPDPIITPPAPECAGRWIYAAIRRFLGPGCRTCNPGTRRTSARHHQPGVAQPLPAHIPCSRGIPHGCELGHAG
jgi:hypothetical protein